jgi:predicted O-methyltransferase YrrM
MAIRRPWWPYEATTWMAEHLPGGARVFEYGGGGSTLWLEDQGAEVTVIEHHDEWAQQLAVLAPNTRVIKHGAGTVGKITSVVEPGFFDDYVTCVADEPDDSFDLVIVDGRARVECVRRSMPKVKPGGLLVLDDTGRPRYRPAIMLLAGWERHVFQGFKPGDRCPAETSVWRRPST